jgi:hypothetical protein
MAKLNFNAADVEPIGSFDPLPVGDYEVIITETEMKDTKNGKGKYLQLTFEVVGEENKGRKVWDRLNLINENSTAQEIAQRSLSAICRAVGVLHPTDSDELKDIPLIIKVGIRPASGEYQPSNIIKGYARCDGESLTEIRSPTPAHGKTSKKPWER